MSEQTPTHQPDAPPPWFQQFTEQLGGALQHQNAQIQHLAQRVSGQAAQQPPPPKLPTPPVNEVRDRLLTTIANEPERFVSELVGFADQRADQKLNAALHQQRMEFENARAAERFWGEFYGMNPDLTLLTAEVEREFQAAPHPDPSVRANMARDTVRQKVQMLQQAQDDMRRQQEAQRRGMAGAPGVGSGAPQGNAVPRMDETERTAAALDERAAWRAKRMGSQIRNDEDYHEQVRQVALQRRRARSAA